MLDMVTIYGLSVKSEFTVAVKIQMEPHFLSTREQAEREIPIIIRSKWDGNHIQDIMQLQNLELRELHKQITNSDKFPFISKNPPPFVLAGCRMNLKQMHD